MASASATSHDLASGTLLIRVENVRKTYDTRDGAVAAIATASFDVAAGSFVSLLGPSGCGKSTLLLMLAGLEQATAGRLAIGGEPVTAPRRDIGIVFQDATLLPWKSALDNVLFPIKILKRPIADYRARAAELLDLVGLSGFHGRKPAQLSGGMRQRVAICRALIHDPDILLMDEPFSALDAITRDQMNLLLTELLEKLKKTVVFVTHSIREAAFLSDRVLVMGSRPSTITLDATVPLARPRSFAVEGSPAFNDLCVRLRRSIEAAHAAEPPPPAPTKPALALREQFHE